MTPPPLITSADRKAMEKICRLQQERADGELEISVDVARQLIAEIIATAHHEQDEKCREALKAAIAGDRFNYYLWTAKCKEALALLEGKG